MYRSQVSTVSLPDQKKLEYGYKVGSAGLKALVFEGHCNNNSYNIFSYFYRHSIATYAIFQLKSWKIIKMFENVAMNSFENF